MARVAVNVVIKPEILDPQGKAILAAFGRIGHQGVTSVRQGKHFELDVDASVSDADLQQLAATVLANPVIENWSVHRLADDEEFVGDGEPDSADADGTPAEAAQ